MAAVPPRRENKERADAERAEHRLFGKLGAEHFVLADIRFLGAVIENSEKTDKAEVIFAENKAVSKESFCAMSPCSRL